jgi:excisionase family DNA binding protein
MECGPMGSQIPRRKHDTLMTKAASKLKKSTRPTRATKTTASRAKPTRKKAPSTTKKRKGLTRMQETVAIHGAPQQKRRRLVQHELKYPDPEQPTKMEQMYTVNQAAKLLSLSPFTLRHWMGRGRVRYERVGANVRIAESELLKLRTRFLLPEAS